jgi:penicillin-insensitive murein endopeptidase
VQPPAGRQEFDKLLSLDRSATNALMRLAALVASLLLVSATALPAEAKQPRPPHARSVGSPNEGQLQGGKQLKSSSSLRSVGGHRWGVPELVDMLTRSAAKVAKSHPGSVLTVADLSKRGGGDIDGHKSHESGRDADVAFYLRKGKSAFVAPRFAKIEEDFRAANMKGVSFDAERSWALVEAWLTDPSARVLQIFVASHLKKRMLEVAAASGASEAVRRRAAEVLIQPKNALPHDDHFHVRIACPTRSESCENFAKVAAKPKPKVKSRQARSKQAGPRPRAKPQASTRVKDMSSSKR